MRLSVTGIASPARARARTRSRATSPGGSPAARSRSQSAAGPPTPSSDIRRTLAHFCANLSKMRLFLTWRVTLRILSTECQARGDNPLDGEKMERDARWMTVKELAAYLTLNERTVLKLAGEGPMPAVKVGNQWRFRKAMIDTWLDDQMLGISRRYVDPPRTERAGRLLLDLASCFAPSHILPDLAAHTKTTAVEELAAHAHSLGLVRDKTGVRGRLVRRA